MKIEIWSDVVCPWCYIGKRRIENALAEFGHADEVEVHWRSYQLDPGAPTEPTEGTAAMLARKYGQSADGARQMQDRVEAVAAEEGLVYRLSQTLHLNTVDAHRLIHLAHQQGGNDLQGRVKEALLAAYFTEARNVADQAVLREVAVASGLDASRVDEVLGSREFEDDVHADAEQAQAYGATGVPFFVIDQKYGQSADGARQMQDRVEAVAAEEGLVYRLSQTLHLNTVDAHRLIHLAHQQGGNDLQGRVKEALLAAYFTEARNVADHAVLREVAVAAGLDATRVDEVLGSREFEDDVHADAEQAQAYGATGVPFFVIDERYGVSGAQPTEVFTQVLERAWSETHPLIEVLATGEECGPDGCAI